MSKQCPGPKSCKVRKCGTDQCPLKKEEHMAKDLEQNKKSYLALFICDSK